MRTISVITVGRSDYGIYLPVLRRIQQDADLRLHLIVSGAHLSPEFGLTVNAIESDGFEIAERVEMLLSSDTPEGIAKSVGLATIGFAQAYARFRSDILLVLGDRFEMHAAVVAATPFGIPVAHIHGGESTEGAIDEAFRHSITKMSHLHFVATEAYARRIVQMGEEPWRVIVAGAPSLDNLRAMALLGAEELARQFGITVPSGFLLVTYHPVTTEHERVTHQVRELLAALERAELPTIVTYPNADTGSRSIIQLLNDFTARHPSVALVTNLGTQGYFSLMHLATAMVGNSSSGIVEAASFRLPVVNIGPRQGGRMRAKNVIDVACDRADILAGIRQAISPEFRATLADLVNPYGDGRAAESIVEHLKRVTLDRRLLQKRFHER